MIHQLVNELEASVVNSARDRGLSSEIGTKAAELARKAVTEAKLEDGPVVVRTFHKVANEFFANLTDLQRTVVYEARMTGETRRASHRIVEDAVRSACNAVVEAKLAGKDDQAALWAAKVTAAAIYDRH